MPATSKAKSKRVPTKIPEFHYSPEEIAEVRQGVPAYAKLTNKNHQQFVLAWIDHSQLGVMAIADGLKCHYKSIRNWLNNPDIVAAVRKVSLLRANASDAKCCALMSILVDRIAEKIINEGVDPGDLSRFEQEIIMTGRNRVDPPNPTIKITEEKSIKGNAASMQSLIAGAFNEPIAE